MKTVKVNIATSTSSKEELVSKIFAIEWTFSWKQWFARTWKKGSHSITANWNWQVCSFYEDDIISSFTTTTTTTTTTSTKQYYQHLHGTSGTGYLSCSKIVLVISPLKSLMTDQCCQLRNSFFSFYCQDSFWNSVIKNKLIPIVIVRYIW